MVCYDVELVRLKRNKINHVKFFLVVLDSASVSFFNVIQSVGPLTQTADISLMKISDEGRFVGFVYFVISDSVCLRWITIRKKEYGCFDCGPSPFTLLSSISGVRNTVLFSLKHSYTFIWDCILS